VSRLEHEIASKDNGVKDADARAKEKLDAQKAKIEGLMNDRSDLEMRLQRLQQSLDAATSQARTLQYSNHNIQTTLGDSSAKQSALKQEAHGKLNEVTSQLKRVTQERDNEQNLRNELQKTLDAMRANIEEANVIKEQSKAEMAKQKADMEAALNRHNAAMNSAGTTAGQYQNQLKQTQELLKVVQAQRAELQNQCKTLRSELDTAYKKNAVAQDDDDEE
jgi:chromosome segregation ATPase